MKTVAVIQSNYIPWKGYFDIINDADVFIFYDDVQYTKNDWRNRNKLKSATGTTWITVPTGTNLNQLIYEVEIQNQVWQMKHWKMIQNLYSRSPYFKQHKEFFEHIYLGSVWQNLSELNQTLIKAIATQFLGIKTEFQDSRQYQLSGTQVDRLLDLLQKAGTSRYISGPSAKAYISDSNEVRFWESDIVLEYKDYSGYPKYKQLYPPFEHTVSILDVLFNCGSDAPYYIWGWREQNAVCVNSTQRTYAVGLL